MEEKQRLIESLQQELAHKSWTTTDCEDQLAAERDKLKLKEKETSQLVRMLCEKDELIQSMQEQVSICLYLMYTLLLST